MDEADLPNIELFCRLTICFYGLSKLYRFIGGFLMMESSKTKLHTYTRTFVLVNNNKRCSIYNIVMCYIINNISLHVFYETGEVCYCGNDLILLKIIIDGRGFILAYIQMNLINTEIVSSVFIQNFRCTKVKKAKYLNQKYFYLGHIVRGII